MERDRLLALFDIGRSTRSIAKEFGVSQTTIRYWLKKYKFPKKANPKPEWNANDIVNSVKSNHSVAGVLRTLNKALVGSNYKRLYKEIAKLSLDTSHWLGKRSGTGGTAKIEWSEVLTKNSKYKLNSRRKQALIRDGILINKCYICNSFPIWNGRTLMLRLDHINGVRNDHRRENIRLVCPNCDSQLPTYCGRNRLHIRAAQEANSKFV